jgi:hypothetical protein
MTTRITPPEGWEPPEFPEPVKVRILGGYAAGRTVLIRAERAHVGNRFRVPTTEEQNRPAPETPIIVPRTPRHYIVDVLKGEMVLCYDPLTTPAKLEADMKVESEEFIASFADDD